MGTSSTIAAVMPEGYVMQVYCNWDGYISHNGKILQHHYNTVAKIRALLEHGSISSLEREIGEKHDFNNRPEGVCTFYHRDRDEPLEHTAVNLYADVNTYLTECSKEEYAYFWDGEKWWCSTEDCNSTQHGDLLADAIILIRD